MKESGSTHISCKNCGQNFEPKRITAKFCSSLCRVSNSRAKRKKNSPKVSSVKTKKLEKCTGNVIGECPNNATTGYRKSRQSAYKCRQCRSINSTENAVANMFKSYFGKSLISVVKQAGTLETFGSVDDIDFYWQLNKKCRSYGSVSNGLVQAEYNRCHLVPASGKEVVGLTNEYNLVVGDSQANKVNGNKELFTKGIEGKHFINRADLDSRWLVRMKPDHDIWEMFVERFGNDLALWSKKNKFRAPVKNDYKTPTRNMEMLLSVVHGELFTEAGLTILYDLEPLFSFGEAWSNFRAWADQNKTWEVKNSLGGLEVEHLIHGSNELLEPVGKLVQKFMFTGEVEFLESAESELKKLQA